MAAANPVDATRPALREPWFWGGFAVIVLLAAGLRFWELARAPIWMDEAFTVLVARLPVRALMFEHVDVHPPLVYLVQKLWAALSGGDLSLTRAPAALFGVLGVAALTLSVSDLVSRRAGLLAGLFLALSTGHVYFSQDARMYAMLTLNLALAAWGAVGWLGRPEQADAPEPMLKRRGYAALYLAGATAAVYSHVAGLIFLAALNLGCLIARYLTPGSVSPRPWLRGWFGLNLVLLLLALPWLIQIPGQTGAFGGLGEAPVSSAPWFLRNAVGFGGLPGLVRKPAEVLLFLAVGWGAALAWRQGRRAFVIAGLTVLVCYSLAVAGFSLVSPMLANRIFLPMSLIVAGFLGCALERASRAGIAGAAVAVCALVLMGASTVAEHAARTKYENVPAALAFARRDGLEASPVLTCNFYSAGTTWAVEPRRAVYIAHGDEVMRFDPRVMTGLRKSIAWMSNARLDQIDGYLGGGYLVPGGLGEVLRDGRGAVVLSQPCEPGYGAHMRGRMLAAGLSPRGSQAFRGGRGGEVVMQRGETVADLYAAQP